MASALSCTAWIVSLMWTFSIARIASRSLASLRPIISSIVDMALLLVGCVGVGCVEAHVHPGEDEGLDEAARDRGIGEVEVGDGLEPVRHDEARHPLTQVAGG